MKTILFTIMFLTSLSVAETIQILPAGNNLVIDLSKGQFTFDVQDSGYGRAVFESNAGKIVVSTLNGDYNFENLPKNFCVSVSNGVPYSSVRVAEVTPEPCTVLLLGIGAGFLRKRVVT